MLKKRCVQALALGVLWLLATVSVKADGPKFTVWGSVTYESAQGPPVEGVIVHCHRVVAGGHYDTYPLEAGWEGQYKFEFEGVAEQLRIYVELPSDMQVIGSSSCSPCGPWGGVETVNCRIPQGQSSYHIGPIRFFVGFVFPPTAAPTLTPTTTPTPTSILTPTATPTPTITLTPSLTPTATLVPTETPYLLPTAVPKKPTPATQLECSQRRIEQGYEQMALLRFIAAVVVGMAAALAYDIRRS